jgi:hypothetical protein
VRLLSVFAASAAVTLAAVAALNWWVDPFGEFWKPAAVRNAERAPSCLISRALFQNAQLPFKLGVFRDRPTRTVVFGTSRVLSIKSHPGERSFTNLGLLAGHASDALWLARRIPARPRLTVYLDVEVYWLSPNSGHHDFAPGVGARGKYLVSWTTLSRTLHLLRSHPDALLNRWTRASPGGHCIVGHGLTEEAWRPDGSIIWESQLFAGGEPIVPISPEELEQGFFGGYTSFARGPLEDLSSILTLARKRAWTVVGFSPPYPAAYVRDFLRDPQLRARWRDFGRIVPALFQRYGYPLLDLRNARDVPCASSDYIDGGFHFDDACSARIRAKLDAVAATYDARH